MSLKKTKTPIMGVSAFLILLFHLFPMPRGGDFLSVSARFIILTAYIGVDIFFFMSGYMSYFSDTGNYLQYIKRKLLNIYPVFILSCVIYISLGKLSLREAFLTLIGVELFRRGGGSFLWFAPAIIIFYLLVPLYLRWTRKTGKIKTLILSLAIWLVLMLILEQSSENHAANIFLCRIPIILIGIAAAEHEGRWRTGTKLAAAVILLVSGIFLTWKFGYMIKADFFITDVFYIMGIPHALGALLLMDVAFSKYNPSFFFKNLGKISFELYCLQMALGAFLFEFFVKKVQHGIAAFILVFICITAISFALRYLKLKLKSGKTAVKEA